MFTSIRAAEASEMLRKNSNVANSQKSAARPYRPMQVWVRVQDGVAARAEEEAAVAEAPVLEADQVLEAEAARAREAVQVLEAEAARAREAVQVLAEAEEGRDNEDLHSHNGQRWHG